MFSAAPVDNKGYYDVNKHSTASIGNYLKRVDCGTREDRMKKSIHRLVNSF